MDGDIFYESWRSGLIIFSECLLKNHPLIVMGTLECSMLQERELLNVAFKM